MKSDPQQLKSRGLFDPLKQQHYQDASKEELISLLNSDADIRTIAIRLLSLKYHNDEDYTDILLQQFIKEKALYTKIEIQDNLAQYGQPKKMCQYLGKIGHNQYKSIPNKVSLKKSYPLARDLIARSLSHINIAHFDDFFASLQTLSYQQLLEGIDALGFVCFYHPSLIRQDVYQFVENCIFKYQDDLLMTWKLITCLSAFPQSIELLSKMKTTAQHPTILKEIDRSFNILNSHL